MQTAVYYGDQERNSDQHCNKSVALRLHAPFSVDKKISAERNHNFSREKKRTRKRMEVNAGVELRQRKRDTMSKGPSSRGNSNKQLKETDATPKRPCWHHRSQPWNLRRQFTSRCSPRTPRTAPHTPHTSTSSWQLGTTPQRRHTLGSPIPRHHAPHGRFLRLRAGKARRDDTPPPRRQSPAARGDAQSCDKETSDSRKITPRLRLSCVRAVPRRLRRPAGNA